MKAFNNPPGCTSQQTGSPPTSGRHLANLKGVHTTAEQYGFSM